MKLFVPSAVIALVKGEIRTVETYEIFSLLEHFIPDLEDAIPTNGLEDYGCTGVGNMEANVKNYGRPIDEIDTALNNRKHCINCASSEIGGEYSNYQFDRDNNYCSKHMCYSSMLLLLMYNV